MTVRTHHCNQLRASDMGSCVSLAGWVDTYRDHGGVLFIDLRDREGITQIVIDPQAHPEMSAIAKQIRTEFVVAIDGQVEARPDGNANAEMPTGAIDVRATHCRILNPAKTPPFVIADESEVTEELRLKYRFLDLRRPRAQAILRTRHEAAQFVRAFLSREGFYEVETPFLTKSTPEGARDYLVPARNMPGSFYALPQSPQIFKQLLMVSGCDRYFQIVKCFRDEDLRADRQPEFTQIDIEISFIETDPFLSMCEQMITTLWREVSGVEVPQPVPRIRYADAMARFGTDAPDLRIPWELVDCGAILAGTEFRAIGGALKSGGCVKALTLSGHLSHFSRKVLDGLPALVERFGAKGVLPIRCDAQGTWTSPLTKFLDAATQARLGEAIGLTPGSVALLVADQPRVVNATLDFLRRHFAKTLLTLRDDDFQFCWIVDFPLMEWDGEANRHVSLHHPFTAPHSEDLDQLDTDPAACRAQAYDLVVNGSEIGGGSVRIHEQVLQEKIFQLLKLSAEEISGKFGFLLEALQYGAPPHGGIAFGFDRIMMLLTGASSLREVIAFPKTARGTDLMVDAPSPVSQDQLRELGLKITS